MRTTGPLHGVRVVDMADGKVEMCGRFLADLGADVVLVEPPAGHRSRSRPPLVGEMGVHFATHHANKRGIRLDLDVAADRSMLRALLGRADIWIETSAPGDRARLGLSPDAIRSSMPHLVVVSVTDFGQTGPYRDRRATSAVQLAMTGALARSGQPGGPPLMPPEGLADEAAAVQAAWAAMLAYWRRLESGCGDHVDVSVFEAVLQVMDPAHGTLGTAAIANPFDVVSRGRPDSNPYPIFAARDGDVRVAVLSARQWRSMWSWLGEPSEFADPSYDRLAVRLKDQVRLSKAMQAVFEEHTVAQLVAEGQRRGIPIAPVLSAGEVLRAAHFVQRGALLDAEIARGVRARMPSGYVEIDQQRMGFRARAPELGEHDQDVRDEWLATRPPDVATVGVKSGVASPSESGMPPLHGLRVLDLGVIVLGAEAGRLFADQGAEVIKIESREYPDGFRNANGGAMSPTFVAGHRGKQSMGLNLRTAEGLAIFKRLVQISDVVLSNFKPGTLESLGLGYDVLRAVNPGLVMVSSSALGHSGPWSTWMGYGPLVRAVSGLSSLWRSSPPDAAYGDTTTVCPDHFAARVMDVAGLAALIARRRVGSGAHVQSAQAESILVALSDVLVRESLQPGTVRTRGNIAEHAAPYGVYRCLGEDEWCVIAVEDDGDWQRMCAAIGAPNLATSPEYATAAQRLRNRATVEAAVAQWTALRTPGQVTDVLQAAGVAAGPMQRVGELYDDPHLAARRFFRTIDQPQLDRPVVTENGPARFALITEPRLGRAPMQGEHTRQICASVLGMDGGTIDQLMESGVLHEPE